MSAVSACLQQLQQCQRLGCSQAVQVRVLLSGSISISSSSAFQGAIARQQQHQQSNQRVACAAAVVQGGCCSFRSLQSLFPCTQRTNPECTWVGAASSLSGDRHLCLPSPPPPTSTPQPPPALHPHPSSLPRAHYSSNGCCCAGTH